MKTMNFGEHARVLGKTVKALGLSLALLAAPQVLAQAPVATASEAAPVAAAASDAATPVAVSSPAAAVAVAPAIDPSRLPSMKSIS